MSPLVIGLQHSRYGKSNAPVNQYGGRFNFHWNLRE